MHQGLSPVISAVLLIAMAVIGSVILYFWSTPYTSAQPVPKTTQKIYTVMTVYKNSSGNGCQALDIKNSGGYVIRNLIIEVRDEATGKQVGSNGTNPNVAAYINISFLGIGDIAVFNISSIGNASNITSVPFGTYILRPSTRSPVSIAGYTDNSFSCSIS